MNTESVWMLLAIVVVSVVLAKLNSSIIGNGGHSGTVECVPTIANQAVSQHSKRYHQYLTRKHRRNNYQLEQYLNNLLIDNTIIYQFLEMNIGKYEHYLPEQFSALEVWPHCADIIGRIVDQGACGSCWAISSTSAMSDRICIHTNGRIKLHISAQDLIECCPSGECSSNEHDEIGGCYGGDPAMAWRYFVLHGLVSGGEYGSGEGCKPYQVPPCPIDEHTGKRIACDISPNFNVTQCANKCIASTSFATTTTTTTNTSVDNNTGEIEQQKTISTTHQVTTTKIAASSNNRFYGSSFYRLPQNEQVIQLDILSNGPVVASFNIYSDFLHYTDGVYQRDAHASSVIGHSVRLIGWGVENGTKYWLAANSWSKTWGNLGGFFKIRRGVNECGIEADMSAGLPKV